MRALPRRQRSHSCLESMGLWADTRTGLYKKGLRPQGLGLLYFFSPAPNRSPGASGPLVVWTTVQEIPYPPVFLKRKPANFLGAWGQSPRRLFASFLHAEKGCGRAFDGLFGRIAFFMRRQTENLFFRSCHKAQAVLFRLSGLSPFRHDVQRAVPLLEEDDVRYHLGPCLLSTSRCV